MKESEYHYIEVESFIPQDLSGRHGEVHIRALPNQEPFSPKLFVSCSKKMSENYAVGTKFRIKAKIKHTTGNAPCIWSHYLWKFDVL